MLMVYPLRDERPQRPSCLPHASEIEVLTYVSRGFEEYRGFPQAMQTIAMLQSRRPNLHVLIVGLIWWPTALDDPISAHGVNGLVPICIGPATHPLDGPFANALTITPFWRGAMFTSISLCHLF